ncbi:hypothetical protein RRG08_044216 [Elysia crispata]|uniref:Uncharacterized protein n=1 Tax=Elysia crispata TaxID=231223 RepID=A0AAE0XWM9_9GAST|nr:hypothetical protein RRG08_044216 [Elysia crispata]
MVSVWRLRDKDTLSLQGRVRGTLAQVSILGRKGARGRAGGVASLGTSQKWWTVVRCRTNRVWNKCCQQLPNTGQTGYGTNAVSNILIQDKQGMEQCCQQHPNTGQTGYGTNAVSNILIQDKQGMEQCCQQHPNTGQTGTQARSYPPTASSELETVVHLDVSASPPATAPLQERKALPLLPPLSVPFLDQQQQTKGQSRWVVSLPPVSIHCAEIPDRSEPSCPPLIDWCQLLQTSVCPSAQACTGVSGYIILLCARNEDVNDGHSSAAGTTHLPIAAAVLDRESDKSGPSVHAYTRGPEAASRSKLQNYYVYHKASRGNPKYFTSRVCIRYKAAISISFIGLGQRCTHVPFSPPPPPHCDRYPRGATCDVLNSSESLTGVVQQEKHRDRLSKPEPQATRRINSCDVHSRLEWPPKQRGLFF